MSTVRFLVFGFMLVGASLADRDTALRAYQQGDFPTALKEWQGLADSGNAEAEFRVGVMYEHGQGIPAATKEAANWYRKAADQAYAQAQYALGMLYANGQGGLQDNVQAYMWLDLSSALGVAEAAREREKVAEKMTPEQIAEARRLVEEWKATLLHPPVVVTTDPLGNGSSPPVALYRVDPTYSKMALKKKLQGTVVLHLIVDTEGRARDIKVVESLGLGLDEKAIEAVGQWKFRPGYRQGKPVTVQTTIGVNFQLLKTN
jgi:TonB family protein